MEQIPAAALRQIVGVRTHPKTNAQENPNHLTAMISKLLMCDPKDVTQARACAVAKAEVSRLITEQGMSIFDAWKQLRETEPDLMERINQGPDAGDALANSNPARAFPTAVPTVKTFYLSGMKLPPNTTDAEFACAWRANGARQAPLNAPNVFIALVGFIAGSQKISIADARRAAFERFPALAVAAGEMPAATATAAAAAESGSQYDYATAFTKALAENHNDPILAHQAVMRQPGAASLFSSTPIR